MDDALSKSLQRIVEGNQKARAQSAERAARLMDALVDGPDRENYEETINAILNSATGRTNESGVVLGKDGEAKPADGNADGSGPQANT